MPELAIGLGAVCAAGLVRLSTTLKEVHADYVVLSGDSRIDTYSTSWVAGVTPSPQIATLGLETERATPPPFRILPSRASSHAHRPAPEPAGKDVGPQYRHKYRLRRAG